MKGILFLASCILYCSSLPVSKIGAGTPVPGYTLMYFNATIDHYFPNSPTYSMRYYIRTDYWNQTKNGPIFFYCGNEGAIEMFALNTGYMDTLAGQMHAVSVFAEHRYFGGSMPFGNSSYSNPNNLKYLSPHQALADFAQLIEYLKREFFGAPVIVWGGSYGGMLAAWMRMKFTHLVDGAIAASAPVMHFNGTVDPNEFNALVTRHFSIMGGPECPAIIRAANAFLLEMMGNPQYYFELQNLFNTCQDIITSDDVLAIMNWLANAFTYMAMTDYSSPSNFLQYMPAYPVAMACGNITSNVLDISDYTEVFPAVVLGANIYYNYNNQSGLTCNNLNLTSSQGNLGDEGWDYLACTTMNMPIGSNGASDMFWNAPWDQGAVDSQCLQSWGEATQVNYAQVWFGTSLNTTYILRHASNILFSTGSLDPWLSGSVIFSENPNLVVYVMEGASHHADLRAPTTGDLPDVVAGRIAIRQSIQYWINGTIS